MEIDTKKLISIIEPMVPIFSKGDPETVTSCVVFKQAEWPKMKLISTTMFTSIIVDVEFDGVGKSWRSGVAYTDMIDFAVNGRVLMGLISKLTSSRLRISYDKKRVGWITISTSTSTYEVQYQEANRIPSSVMNIPTCQMQVVDRGTFIEALHYGGRFNSSNESTGAMSGVAIILSSDSGGMNIECHSTDAKRLARFRRTTANKISSELKFLISRSQADQVKEILASYEEPVFEIGREQYKVLMKTKTYSLVFSPMNLDPLATISQVAAMPFSKSVVLNRKKVLEAMSRLERVQNDEFQRIIIEVSSVTTIRKADVAAGIGFEIISNVSSDITEPIECAFSHFNIYASINAFDKCDEIEISFNMNHSEVMAAKVSSKSKPSAIYIISPVSLGKAKGK